MKSPLSRRRFCVLAACPLLSGLSSFSARAQNEPPKTTNDLPAQALHAIGVRMLREGRAFEKAAARFQLAAQKEPEDAGHFIALGCAWASRAASVSRAALFTQTLTREQADYPGQLKKWEAGRADYEEEKARNPQFYVGTTYEDRKPKPPPPYEFMTKDDKAPFRLTPLESSIRLSELSRLAQKAWKQGIELSKTPDEKAEAYYVQAWGLHLLRECLMEFDEKGEVVLPAEEGDDATATPVKPRMEVPMREAAVKAVEETVRLAPSNALYAQASGDLLEDTSEEKSFAAYEKAILLAPGNANLLYFMYQKAVAKALKESEAPDWAAYTKGELHKPDEERFAVPLRYLHRAAAHDRANAWALYEEANVLFRLAPYDRMGGNGLRNATPLQTGAALDSVRNPDARKRGKRAVDLIVRGNGLPRYTTPCYAPCVPLLLKQVADLMPPRSGYLPDETGDSFAHLRELARAAGGYAHVMAENDNRTEEGVRASRAAVGMGFHVIGSWPAIKKAYNATEAMEPLVGGAVVLISYRILIQVYGKIGDTDRADAVQKELTDFQPWFNACVRLLAKRGGDLIAAY